MRLISLVAISTIALSLPALAASEEKDLPGLYPASPERSAAEILSQAYDVAGGQSWLRPKSLFMSGYGVFYRDGRTATYDDYRMWRVFAGEKKDAHVADGKVRIEAKKDGAQIFLITFDGEKTYDANGPIEDQSANARWSSNFGFGAIRHALDDGWAQKRLPDVLIDGRPAYLVELTDPAGGMTRFAVDQETYHVLYVGFDTARGWHERRYSNFFTKPGIKWVQPGRVRLFYDGVKQNEIIWTDYEIDNDFDDAMFVVEVE